MLNLITKLAIYDPETNEHVILKNIMEGVDGAAAFSWQEEPISVQIEDGQTLDHTLEGTLDIKVLRGSTADLSVIDGVVGKRAMVSAITVNGFLLLHGEYYINRVPDFNSNILNDQIRLTARRLKGYNPESQSQGFYGGLNGLMLFDILNGYDDGDGDVILGGFQKAVASATYTVSDGVQTMVTTAAGSGRIETKERIFYPFSDNPFTYSVGLISSGGADLQLVMSGKENHDSETAISNTVNAQGDRVSASWDYGAAPNARFFQFRIGAPGAVSEETTYQFEKPALRLGTSDKFAY